jgi:hypothetical protein
MASTQQSKVLRIGVVQDGRILEERHLGRPEDVTIGQDAKKCSLYLPVDALPDSQPVFEYRHKQYHLVFSEDMQGRVDLGSSTVELHTLIAQGQAQPRADLYVLPLPDGSRGQLVMGEVSLFFQFVTPPPPPSKAELPPDMQGSAWRSMDRMFLTILAASLFLHFSCAALIISARPPPEPELSLDQLDDRFARVFIPPKQEKPVQAAETAQAAQADTKDEKPKAEGEDKAQAEASKPSGAEDAATQRAEVVKKVAGKGLLKILGSSGSGGGAFSDVLGGSTGGGDIAEALAGAGGVGIATTESSVGAGGPRGGGTGSVAGIGELGTSGGGNVDLGSKKEVQVSGRVSSAAPEVDSADVDREALARYVKARLKAIQDCYEKELKRNPSLRGKVIVRFNILTSGRTGDIEIEENTLGNDAVASCIRTKIRGWTFPFKPDEEVPVAYPFVFSPAG